MFLYSFYLIYIACFDHYNGLLIVVSTFLNESEILTFYYELILGSQLNIIEIVSTFNMIQI